LPLYFLFHVILQKAACVRLRGYPQHMVYPQLEQNFHHDFTLFFAELLKKTLLFHRFFDIICIRATVIHRSLPFPFNKNKGCFLRPNRRAAHTHLYAGFLC
jgi:hypothetical protein